MARHGVSYGAVEDAAQAIEEAGQAATVMRVRERIGTGSASTIARHLKAWRGRHEVAGYLAAEGQVPAEVHRVAEGAWTELSALADARAEAVREEEALKAAAVRAEAAREVAEGQAAAEAAVQRAQGQLAAMGEQLAEARTDTHRARALADDRAEALEAAGQARAGLQSALDGTRAQLAEARQAAAENTRVQAAQAEQLGAARAAKAAAEAARDVAVQRAERAEAARAGQAESAGRERALLLEAAAEVRRHAEEARRAASQAAERAAMQLVAAQNAAAGAATRMEALRVEVASHEKGAARASAEAAAAKSEAAQLRQRLAEAQRHAEAPPPASAAQLARIEALLERWGQLPP